MLSGFCWSVELSAQNQRLAGQVEQFLSCSRPVIDTHAHALPAISRGSGTRLVHELLSRAANRLVPSRSPIEIEVVSRLERSLPPLGFRAFEEVSALAVMSAALVGGALDGLLSSMARHGVARTVLIGARGRIPNRWILEEAWPTAPERLVPVTTLPELSRRSATLEEWVEGYRALAKAGAAGFKIHPNWDDVLPGHPSYGAASRSRASSTVS